MTTTVLAYIPSPPQGVWHVWILPIRAYALFIIVGIVAALVIGDRRWVARGGEPGVIYDIALYAVPFGLIGGRLYHVMTDWRTYFGEDGAGLAGAFRIWDGGLGIWGAVALGGVGAWWACRKRGIPLPAFGDAIAPGIILAQAIGRLGNYFNQELYGRPTTLPWGLEIYERRNSSGVLDSLNGVSTGQPVEIVHPTFLYELLWNVLVFAALIWIDRRFKIGHGRLFAMYVAGYCLGRFWIELMRSDVATHIAGIRVNSFTSTFVFIGAVVYIMVAPKGREDPASLAGKPKDVEEETPVEEFVKELTTVGATSGVVAAAKAAGEAEDEDAKAGAESDQADIASEAEKMGADVAGVPADNLAEAEEFAAEGDEEAEPESEAAAEAEALAQDVDAAPAADIAEAQAFAEAGEKAEPEAGLGAIEPEEAAEAEVAASEAHEAAAEAVEEAEEVAAEVAEESDGDVEEEDAESVGEAAKDADEVAAEVAEEESEADEPEAERDEPEEEEAADDSEEVAPEAEAEGVESVGGVGAVEGEEAAEAEAAAPEAHEAAVEAADEAEDVAAEIAEESDGDDESEAEPEGGLGSIEPPEAAEAEAAAPEAHEAAVEAADEAEDVAAEVAEESDADDDAEDAETEDAEAAVEEAAESEPSEDQAEAVVEEADAAADDEPSTGVLAAETEPETTPATVRPTEQSGGRLRRLLRRNR